MKYLKPEELKTGYLYKIDARHATVGIWMGLEFGEFLTTRWKCGENFLFEEVHVDLSDGFGTAKPLREVEKSPFNMKQFEFSFNKNDKALNYLNKFEKEPLWTERRK